MAAPPTQTKQTNVVANKARHLVFFEEDSLCYNYATGQWSYIAAYAGYGMFSVNSKTADIGLVVYSSGSVDLQTQTTSDIAQTALLTTGAKDFNQGGRTLVNGVRPLGNGGTYAVRVGTQDSIGGTITYSTGTAVNSRSGFANFRNAANVAEGRYIRQEVTITGGFTDFLGADIDYFQSGDV